MSLLLGQADKVVVLNTSAEPEPDRPERQHTDGFPVHKNTEIGEICPHWQNKHKISPQ